MSLRVLFIPKWYPGPGDELKANFIQNHAECLASHAEIYVLSIHSENKQDSEKIRKEITTENGVKVFRYYYNNSGTGDGFIGKTRKLKRYFTCAFKGLREIAALHGKPHLIHVHVLTRPGIVAWLLKKFKGIPYIITEHWTGYMPQDGRYQGKVKKLFTGIAVSEASAITTVSHNLKHCMEQHGLKGNYHVIRNVVKIPEMVPPPPFADLKILMVCDLVDEMKNVSGVIKAFTNIASSLPQNSSLQIIGNGPDRKKLEQLASDSGLTGKFIFHGALPNREVYKHISECSFLVVNSFFETFSVVAAEALACGKPVLATRCGGPEEFIDETRGKVIEPGNSNQLEQGLIWMTENLDKFDPQRLREYVIENFSPEAISGKFIKLYREVLTRWEAGNSKEIIQIDPKWKVLDVGSGDHPHPRADVLLEKEIEASEHRSGALAVVPKDKTMVVGDATQMPFENKSFDFIIASHIAEHIDDPEKFCSELQRVGTAGYIETPGPLSELFFTERFHKWVVIKEGEQLIFKKNLKRKPASSGFYALFYLNEKREDHKTWSSSNILLIKFVNLLRRSWKHLPGAYTKYHWKDHFQYRVNQ